jgi:hypothetical protein
VWITLVCMVIAVALGMVLAFMGRSRSRYGWVRRRSTSPSSEVLPCSCS